VGLLEGSFGVDVDFQSRYGDAMFIQRHVIKVRFQFS
jgi:hypothetical protein